MKKIEELELEDLVKQASELVIKERGDRVVGIIRKEILKCEQLKKDIDSSEKELIKKREQLSKSIEILDKARDGDWSLLREEENSK